MGVKSVPSPKKASKSPLEPNRVPDFDHNCGKPKGANFWEPPRQSCLKHSHTVEGKKGGTPSIGSLNSWNSWKVSRVAWVPVQTPCFYDTFEGFYLGFLKTQAFQKPLPRGLGVPPFFATKMATFCSVANFSTLVFLPVAPFPGVEPASKERTNSVSRSWLLGTGKT